MSFIMLIISLFSGFTPNSLQRYNIFLICANFSLGIFLYFRFCFCFFSGEAPYFLYLFTRFLTQIHQRSSIIYYVYNTNEKINII